LDSKYIAFDSSEVCVMSCRQIAVKKKAKVSGVGDLARLGAPKLAQILYNTLRVGPRVVLRSVFELLRANVVTRILSAAVLLLIDTVQLLRGRISRKQYLINITLALMLLVGGSAGWLLGNRVISLVVESLVLSIAAGIIGAGVLGAAIGMACEKVIGRFVQDDTADMLDICNDTMAELAAEYKLNENEVCETLGIVAIDSKTVNEMFVQKDRKAYARQTIEPCVKTVFDQRCETHALHDQAIP